MKTCERMKAGDFTHLAGNYAKYRPAYSRDVLLAILGIVNKPTKEINFADIGAGTGIWTRMVAGEGCKSVIAVEPNAAMRKEGESANGSLPIQWRAGSAEMTSIEDTSIDLLSMASSFHWADFVLATQEFHRVLKPCGYFVMLWNPRYLENNPLLLEIENYISLLAPTLRRVSSGKSQHVDQLANQLRECSLFKDIVYIEGVHTAVLTKDQYRGVWESVNDVRVQLGEENFQQFLRFVDEKIQTSTITCSYQTRAWIVKKV